MPDGFISRWSRRKQDVREGKPLADPASTATTATLRAQVANADQPSPPSTPVAPAMAPGAVAVSAEPTPPELPTLADTQNLTPESDFKPFMVRGVAPAVKNAAMKKLFADPHFNVMDRLDTYIDDYSLPDPIPEAMLRKMVSAKFLNLFDDDEKEAAKGPEPDRAVTLPDSVETTVTRDDPGTAGNPLVAQSALTLDSPKKYDDNLDLRLQPDHAPGAEGTGRGAA